MQNENCLSEARRLLGVYTADRFDIWALAGPQRASCRAHVMSALMGQKMPQSKSGINAIRSEFYALANIRGDCENEREERFIAWCKE